MHNDLLTIGKTTIHGYGLMIAIGILAALFISEYRAKKKGMGEDKITAIYVMALLGIVFGFLGAKVLFCIVEWNGFVKDPVAYLTGSGFVVYGGILFGVLSVWAYCKIRKYSFLEYIALIVPAIPIAQGCGRIGCFLAGCCYGRRTDAWYGVIFPHGSFCGDPGVKVVPTQIFSAIGLFVIAAVLMVYASKTDKYNRIMGLYLILYSIGRFIIEFFRADDRGAVGSLSTSQFISLFAVVLGVALFFIPFKNAVKAVVEGESEKPEEESDKEVIEQDDEEQDSDDTEEDKKVASDDYEEDSDHE